MVGRWVNILTATTGTVGLISGLAAVLVVSSLNAQLEFRYREQIKIQNQIIENQKQEIQMLQELLGNKKRAERP